MAREIEISFCVWMCSEALNWSELEGESSRDMHCVTLFDTVELFLGFCHQQHKIYDFRCSPKLFCDFSIYFFVSSRKNSFSLSHFLSFHFTKSIHFNVTNSFNFKFQFYMKNSHEREKNIYHSFIWMKPSVVRGEMQRNVKSS